MIGRYRRFVVGVLAVAGLSLGLATPATAASAPVTTTPAVDCATDTTPPTIAGYSPRAISFGIAPQEYSFAANVSDPCGIDRWQLQRKGESYTFTVQDDDPSPVMLRRPTRNGEAGYSDMIVSAADKRGNYTSQRLPFQLLRRTTFEASTMQVIRPDQQKPDQLNINAKLIRADWTTGRYDFFPGQRVALEHRPLYQTSWKLVDFFTSDRSGWVKARFASSNHDAGHYYGFWRLRYLGNEYSSSTTSKEIDLSVLWGKTPHHDTTPYVPTPNCIDDSEGPELVGYTPTSVAIGTTPRTVPFDVEASDECGIRGWGVLMLRQYYEIRATNTNPSPTLAVPPLNGYAGYNTMGVGVFDDSERSNNTEARYPFLLLRQSTWETGSLTLIPPSGPTQPVTLRGRLAHASWSPRTYGTGLHNHVALEFKPAGSDTWQHARFATTSTDGWVSAKHWVLGDWRTAYKGQWRLRYRGSDIFSPATSPVVSLP